jgi:hypothetical protein
VVSRFIPALELDDVVIGGGNVNKLDKLPPGCRPGALLASDTRGLRARLWEGCRGVFAAAMAGSLMLVVLCTASAAGEPEPQMPESLVITAATATAKDSGQGSGAWLWNELTDEASLTAGYGIMKWALDIQRTADGASGRLVQRDDSSLYVSYSTKPFFFKESNFGYTVMVNYHEFDMTKQEIENDKFADFGTEMHGYVVYAVPTLYCQWGEHRRKGRFVRLGVGAGIGAARFSGNVRLPSMPWNPGLRSRTS